MKEDYRFYVYILTNYRKTSFYVGFTNHIVRRTIEHKNNLGSEFTRKYRLKYLVYYEEYQYVDQAIAREKEIKKWSRQKKLDLIKSVNPNLNDLSGELFKDYGLTKEDIEEYVKEMKSDKQERM